MSISENIRQLAREGHSVSEIARRLGIRYQHAYNVLKPRVEFTLQEPRPKPPRPIEKPTLSTKRLLDSGFARSGCWLLSKNGDLLLEQKLPSGPGVYAFAKDGIALYVGVATIGLSKRIYFYSRPGPTQPTNQRLNEMLKQELRTGVEIEIYTASPPDLEWNGMPVHGSAGLELGLIKSFSLPWNIRSAVLGPLPSDTKN